MCVTSAHEVFALQNLAPDLFTLLKLCTCFVFTFTCGKGNYLAIQTQPLQ